MPFINFSKDEIQCKIVYYGPGFCGKTTNLQYIYGVTEEQTRGKMVSIDTKGDRTLFFDLLSMNGKSTTMPRESWFSKEWTESCL